MAIAATHPATSTVSFSAEGHFQRTLQVTGSVDLSIQTGSSSVAVHTGVKSTVEVRGVIQVWDGLFPTAEARERVAKLESNPPVEQRGNIIKIGDSQEPHVQQNVSISYELVVPANTRLRIRSGSGSQTIDGIAGPVEAVSGSGRIRAANIAGAVQANAGSGSILLEEVKGGVRASTGTGSIRAIGIGGNIRASTGSGNVTLEQTGVVDVGVSTASGNVVLRNVRGPMHAKNAGGSITAEGGGQFPWHLETVSGRISVRVPPHLGFDLRAHTVSGSISTTRSLTLQGPVSGREIAGKARSGGFLLDLSTVSGDIRIDWVA